MLDAMTLAEQSQTLPGPSTEVALPPQVQAATVVLAYLENTQLSVRSKPFEVLQYLAAETKKRASEGRSTDFSAQNLKAALAPDNAREAAGWLSPHWARLIEAEKQWGEGMVATARRQGLAFIPRLEKLQGSPSVYRLRPEPLIEGAEPERVPPVPEGGVFYTTESITAPGAFLSKALRAGIIPWTMFARASLLAVIMTSLISVLLLAWLLLYFGMRITRPLSPADITTGVVFLMLVAGVVSIFRFFGELFELRIMMAPALLTPMSKDNVTLELRRSRDDGPGELLLARYTSTCPVCGGSVELIEGGQVFRGRIVGRCRRSAREHVYSFDPARKVGRPLREND